MRFASDAADPGYEAWQKALLSGRNPKILLDGVEQKHCTMADDDLGLVTRCVLDPFGRSQSNPDNREEVWMETVSGLVEFEFP